MNQSVLSSDRSLLSAAICRALSEKFDAEAASSLHSAECSEKHKAKMRLIMAASRAKEPKRIPIKRIIAIIAIAALLLTGCAMFIFREQIFGFDITIKDGGAIIESEVSVEHELIEDLYILTYIPEGYELSTEWDRTKVNTVFYTNTDNPDSVIKFSQSTPDVYNLNVDTERSERYTLDIDGVDIICYERSGLGATYIWNYDGYVFDLAISFNSDFETEFIKMFKSIEVDSINE